MTSVTESTELRPRVRVKTLEREDARDTGDTSEVKRENIRAIEAVTETAEAMPRNLLMDPLGEVTTVVEAARATNRARAP